MAVKILVFAGSLRKDSFNKKLARVAAQNAKEAGADVTLIDLKDYPLPVYDGDIESSQGLPDNAKKLKKIFLENQALFISSPEYNSSISGTLKNVFDWVSRSETKEEGSLACYKRKVAALLSASPGALGGLRGLVTVRSILGNIGVLVLPAQVAVSKADEAFADDGSLKDARQAAAVKNLAAELVMVTSKLA
jgi:chromate reductase, NAD(P)H dehydrogenase (quinone)